MPKLDRDSVALAYEEAGAGEPPLLFVHGWLCDRTYLAPQLDHFRNRHHVVAVDLRGHGESGHPEQEYTIAGFADDLAWMCGQLDIRRPVVIGHSMGGLIAYELATHFPALPAAVVALDAPLFIPSSRIGEYQQAGEQFQGDDGVNALRQRVEGMFHPDDDRERRASIVDAMSNASLHVAASAWRGMFSSANANADNAGAIAVPMLAVASDGGHMADLERLGALCPHLTIAQTAGVGHFHQLEAPERVNALIEQFLTAALSGNAGG